MLTPLKVFTTPTLMLWDFTLLHYYYITISLVFKFFQRAFGRYEERFYALQEEWF